MNLFLLKLRFISITKTDLAEDIFMDVRVRVKVYFQICALFTNE